MAVANVARGGSNTSTTATATSLVVTPATSPIAGDFIFVTVSTVAAVATTNVTDSAGNKYYKLNDQVGASGRISCWFCPKSSGTVTTVTGTHAAGRCSMSVSTYTGVLGVGHCEETTNAANNNTITMSVAIGSGNVMIAGMGDAVGTQTWTAVTGTLRDNRAGGGSTTPGCTNMDTLVSGGSTLAASLSSSVSGEAIGIEVFGSVLPLQTSNEEYTSDFDVPPMWTLGILQFMMDDREHEDFGLLEPQGVGGVNLMGFRGYTVYPSAMAETVDFGFNPPTPPVQQQFDADLDPPNLDSYYFYSEDLEKYNWGWKPPTQATAKNPDIYEYSYPMQSFYFTEPETEMDNWGYSVGVAGSPNLMGFRGHWSLKAGMGVDVEPGYTPIVVVTVKQPFEDDMLPPYQKSYYLAETEQFDWGFPTTSLGVGGTQMGDFKGFWVKRAGMAVEDQFGFQTAVVTAISAFDQDEGIPLRNLIFQGTSEEEAITEDFVHEMVSVDLMYVYPPQPQWHFAEDEQFGFNLRLAFDQDELPFIDQNPSVQWTDDDKTDSTFFAREQYSDNDEQPARTSWVQYQYLDDEQFGQKAPFLQTIALDDYLDHLPDGWWARDQVEDIQHGQNAPFLTSIAFDEDQYASKNLSYAEEGEFGFTIEFRDDGDVNPQTSNQYYSISVIPDDFGFGIFESFDDIQSPGSQLIITQEDDQFGLQQQFFLVDTDVIDQLPNQPYPLVQWTDDDKTDSTFFSQEQYSDNDEQFVSAYIIRYQEEDVFGLRPPFITSVPFDDFVDQLPNKPFPLVAEDDLVFPPSTVLPDMFYDADFNPTMQRSYYFSAEDLEKYNWGWKPPTLATARDEVLLEYQWPMRSYFIPELESDLDMSQSTFFAREQYGEGLEIQIPQTSYFVKSLENDFDMSQSTFFSQEQFSDNLEIQLPQQSFYFTEPEDEMNNWGFNFITFPAFDQDEIPVITLQRQYHEEDFGFKQQVFITTDDSPEQLFLYNSIRDDVDYFGFNTPVVTVNTAFADDDQRPIKANIYAEEEAFSFDTPFVEREDEIPSHVDTIRSDDDIPGFTLLQYPESEDQSISAGRVTLFSEDETFGFQTGDIGFDDFQGIISDRRIIQILEDGQIAINVVQPFSYGDEELHFPNPPYPVTHQVENDQIGQQAPFIISQPFAWEEDGIPPNPPWPVLDVTDYVDWIVNIPHVVPILKRVLTLPTVLFDHIITEPTILIFNITTTEIELAFVTTGAAVFVQNIITRPTVLINNIYTEPVR